MKVLLADDHWFVRNSLQHAMRSVSPALETFEAGTISEALSHLDQHPDTALMLIDLVMPGTTEFGGLRMLRSNYPDIPIAVVSVHEDRDHVMRAIEEGVVGYIPKSTSGSEVMRALKSLIDGDVAFPRSILLGSRAASAAAPPREDEDATTIEAGMTRRERQVFRLANSGHSTASIAERLGLSPSTVRVHLSNLSTKLPDADKAKLTRAGRSSSRPGRR